MIERNRHTCIDLFAGCGGLSTGLELAGFEIVFANEIHPSYSKSLKINHPSTQIMIEDIRYTDPRQVRKSLGIARGELDLLAGGPPCQGFSINAPIRSDSDFRNHLFNDFIRYVEEFNPSLVLIENVPGMISYEKGETVRSIKALLGELGYEVDARILFAANYGIPQIRWRSIFLASRIGHHPLSLYPLPTHNAKGVSNFSTCLDGQDLRVSTDLLREFAKIPYINVWDAIGDLPSIKNGDSFNVCEYSCNPKTEYQEYLRKDSVHVMNHSTSCLSKINLERMKYIPQGGSWRDIPFELLPKGMKRARRSDHTKRYGRLDELGLGSTILTKCDPHWGTYFHPKDDRVISVREAARLQSFPDKTLFLGSLTEQYAQVGNAVPPLLAKAIGERLVKALTSREMLFESIGLHTECDQLKLRLRDRHQYFVKETIGA